MKIGIIDLDTSHPPSWIPILRAMGHEIVGLLDHGDIHPAGYAVEFARKHNVPRVYGSLVEMVPDVECAIVHSCGWDSHIDRARPFIEADKAVLIDKPLAGNIADLDQIKRWIAAGSRVTGGSSLRFCAEVMEWRVLDPAKRGEPATVVCGCGVDEFNYGIHAYAMLAAVFNEPAASVRHLGGGAAGAHHRVQVDFAGGRTGLVIVGDQATKWLPFFGTIVTDKAVAPIAVDNKRIYQSLLDKTMPYLSGQTNVAPLTADELILPELWAIAAKRSAMEGGRTVAMHELRESDGYEDRAFVALYRKQKYPGGK